MVLARGDVSKLVLDDGVHFSHGKKDSLRELVLVVDGQPPVKNVAGTRLQDLRAL